MLIGIHNQILDTRKDVAHDNGFLNTLIQILTEIPNFVGRSGSNLGLTIFKQILKKEGIKNIKIFWRWLIFFHMEVCTFTSKNRIQSSVSD